MNWFQINIQVNEDFRYMKIHILAPQCKYVNFHISKIFIIIMCQKILACVLVESMSIREDKKDIWKFILFVRATKG